MRLLFSIVSLSFFMLAQASAFTGDKNTEAGLEDMQAEHSVKAVLMYADWCGSCKLLDPKIKKVKAAGGFDTVPFIVLDYTDRDQAALIAQADANEVGEVIRARFGGVIKTGALLLVDTNTNKLIGEATHYLSEDQITQLIQDAIRDSRQQA